MPKVFSFTGRIGRGEYWLQYLALLALVGIGALIALLLPKPLQIAVDVLGYVAAIWIMLAGIVKRLHDTSRSGWWYLAYATGAFFLFIACLCLGCFVAGATDAASSFSFEHVGRVLGRFALCFTPYVLVRLYGLFVIGLQAGDAGENRFGAPNSGSVQNS